MSFGAVRPSGWLVAPIATAETPVKRISPLKGAQTFTLVPIAGGNLRTASTWPGLGKEWRMLRTRTFSASPAGRVYAKSIDQEIAQKCRAVFRTNGGSLSPESA